MTNITMHFGAPVGPEPEVEAHITKGGEGEFAVVIISQEGSDEVRLFFYDKAGAYRFANAVSRAVANMEPDEARLPNLIEGWDGKIVNKLPGGRYE